MKKGIIRLPDNTLTQDLLDWLYSFTVDKHNQEEWELLKKVCTCYLSNGKHVFQIDRIEITKNDKRLIEENNYINAENKEIRARFIDVAIRSGLYKDRKLTLKRECSDLYLGIAYERHSCFAFVRSLLVRDVRKLWDNDFVTRILNVVEKEDFSPHWLCVVADKIKVNIGIDSDVINTILKLYKERYEKEKYNDLQWRLKYVELLVCFEQINKNEAHRRRALVYEAFGNYIVNNKEPNTFYPNLLQIFQDAFNEIDSVKELFHEDWKRVHGTLEKEKINFIKDLSSFGIKTNYEVSDDFKKIVEKEFLPNMSFNTPMDVLYLIMDVPSVPLLMSLGKNVTHRNTLLSMCQNSIQLDSKGNVVGLMKGGVEDINIHRFSRMHILFLLWAILDHYHDLRLQLEESEVYNLLLSKKSRFVNEDILIIWVKGICCIVNDDPLLGSYILMPQVEAILRNIAEEKVGDMTDLSKELQFEYTLSVVLNKIKPYMSKAFNDELRYFFIDGSDVNLRNKMMHGLIDNPLLVNKYSVYLLYFALNLFFREDKFLFQ